MTTIYYNFPAIPLPLQGVNSPSSREIQVENVGQPVVNIQLNHVNYSAQSFIIASSPVLSSSPGHLIIKCYEDIHDTTSNFVFVAIPLITPPTEKPDSEIDNIINSKGETVKLNLNNYIKSGGGCFVSNFTSFPITITLDSDSAIPIKSYRDKTFYTVGKIPDLAINGDPKTNRNATLYQQDLDWIMSCELLTEDGPTEKKTVDPDSTATTISMFLMTIIIATTAYISAPVLYTELGLLKLANNLDDKHISINMFWFVNLIILAIMCFSYGVKSQSSIYSFIAFGLVLSYYSATSAILKMPGIANENGTWFSETEGIFSMFSEIFLVWDCYSLIGKIIKGLMIFLFIYSLSLLSTAIGLGNSALFMSHLLLFLLFTLGLIETIIYLKNN
jgi:hypothetical protein